MIKFEIIMRVVYQFEALLLTKQKALHLKEVSLS